MITWTLYGISLLFAISALYARWRVTVWNIGDSDRDLKLWFRISGMSYPGVLILHVVGTLYQAEWIETTWAIFAVVMTFVPVYAYIVRPWWIRWCDRKAATLRP